jgi:hypothetical protein
VQRFSWLRALYAGMLREIAGQRVPERMRCSHRSAGGRAHTHGAGTRTATRSHGLKLPTQSQSPFTRAPASFMVLSGAVQFTGTGETA